MTALPRATNSPRITKSSFTSACVRQYCSSSGLKRVLTGTVLSLARALGETAPLILTGAVLTTAVAALSPAGEVDRDTPPKLGETWQLERQGLSIKQYPVCYRAHRAIDAMLEITIRDRRRRRSVPARRSTAASTSLPGVGG